MSAARVSVVVAAWPDTRGLGACLAALEPQRGPGDEVVVAAPCSQPADVARAAPWALWAQGGPRLLIPQLWSLGLERTQGDVLALTTAHFVPACDWIDVLRRSHARLDAAAVGGSIEPPRGAGPVAWATYFTRYSAYLGLSREQDLPDLAADNAAYKRAALAPHGEFVRHGFWERELHARLAAGGARLRYVPEMRVRLAASFGFAGFVRQRFRHGRQFGAARVRGRGPGLRAGRLLSSPLVPAWLLGRIALRVARSGRARGRFLLALPLTAAFVLAWSLGEAAGYLRPAHGTAP